MANVEARLQAGKVGSSSIANLGLPIQFRGSRENTYFSRAVLILNHVQVYRWILILSQASVLIGVRIEFEPEKANPSSIADFHRTRDRVCQPTNEGLVGTS